MSDHDSNDEAPDQPSARPVDPEPAAKATEAPAASPNTRPQSNAAEHALAAVGIPATQGEGTATTDSQAPRARGQESPSSRAEQEGSPASAATPASAGTGTGAAAPAPTPDAQPSLPPANFQQRKPRPVLGSSLWVGGTLLWAYVVMGEWVLTIELPEPLAWLIVLGAYVASWVFAVRRLSPEQRRPHLLLAPGVLGIVWFVFVILFTASLLGSSRRSVVAGLTVMLWFVSAAMFAAGRQLTTRRQGRLRGWRRAGVAALWVVAGLGTLVSLFAALERA